MLNTIRVTDRPDIPSGLTVNVAAQYRLELQQLNSRRIAVLADLGLGYNPKRFVAGTGRVRVYPPGYRHGDRRIAPQDVTALLYHTSKVVLTGASNEYMARDSAWAQTFMLHRRLGVPVKMSAFRIENIVCNFFLGYEVDLAKFKESEGSLVDYNPQCFPAAIYSLNKRFTVLVNYTGKLIITGSRDRNASIKYYGALYEKLLPFKTDNADIPCCAQDNSIHEMAKIYRQLQQSFYSEEDLTAIERHDPSFGIGDLHRNLASAIGMDPALDQRALTYRASTRKCDAQEQLAERVAPIDNIHLRTIRFRKTAPPSSKRKRGTVILDHEPAPKKLPKRAKKYTCDMPALTQM